MVLRPEMESNSTVFVVKGHETPIASAPRRQCLQCLGAATEGLPQGTTGTETEA